MHGEVKSRAAVYSPRCGRCNDVARNSDSVTAFRRTGTRKRPGGATGGGSGNTAHAVGSKARREREKPGATPGPVSLCILWRGFPTGRADARPRATAHARRRWFGGEPGNVLPELQQTKGRHGGVGVSGETSGAANELFCGSSAVRRNPGAAGLGSAPARDPASRPRQP
jgi:hypothetical protein